jgi:hypothetical protein
MRPLGELKMKYSEKAAQLGITVEQLRIEQMAFLQNEGYDSHGYEYETFDDWINRKPIAECKEPVHKSDLGE